MNLIFQQLNISCGYERNTGKEARNIYEAVNRHADRVWARTPENRPLSSIEIESKAEKISWKQIIP